MTAARARAFPALSAPWPHPGAAPGLAVSEPAGPDPGAVAPSSIAWVTSAAVSHG